MSDMLLRTVARALVLDAEMLAMLHYANQPISTELWAGFFASISAVRAVVYADLPGRAIPPHLYGRVWKVTPRADHVRASAELAKDDKISPDSVLIVADSAEEAIALVMA